MLNNPFGQAYVYGIVLGPLALPCAGPFLVSLLGISLGVADAAGKIWTFLLFGLGLGCRSSFYRFSRPPGARRSFARSSATIADRDRFRRPAHRRRPSWTCADKWDSIWLTSGEPACGARGSRSGSSAGGTYAPDTSRMPGRPRQGAGTSLSASARVSPARARTGVQLLSQTHLRVTAYAWRFNHQRGLGGSPALDATTT